MIEVGFLQSGRDEQNQTNESRHPYVARFDLGLLGT